MQVKTLTKKLPLSLSPLDAYQRLCERGNKAHTVLLETAEAGSQTDHKSIIAISSALEIKAMNKTVTIKALNDNGRAFIEAFDVSGLSDFEIENRDQTITLKLKPKKLLIDEDQRLSQASSISVLKAIKQQLKTRQKDDDSSSYLVGAMSFDLVDQFEDLPAVKKIDEDYIFYLADQLLIQSLENNSGQIVIKGFADYAERDVHLGLKISEIEQLLNTKKTVSNLAQLQSDREVKVDIDDENFQQQVEQAKDYILDGDVFQVVLARTYDVQCPQPINAYQHLRKSNPSPYMYFLNFGEKQLFGASPESCLKVDNAKQVSLYPIAGTRKRSYENGQIDHEKDALIEYELIADEKEAAEHMMLVDLARNDIARVIENGSRKITQLKKVVKYSHVLHMVSEVKGRIQSNLDPLDAYKACANMGTLTGAPKIKAMEIIRKFEQKPRGFYGGAVAVMNANDEFDSAIVIRSAIVKNQVASITAGAGVVYDSIPIEEAKETDNKAKAVINACLAANLGQEEEVAA